jgi:lipopolysaccharide assembly outer membrane protein LptD (OstA)
MLRGVILIGFLLVAYAVTAQEHISDYDDSIRVEYQYARASTYKTATDSVDFGRSDTHVLLLSGVWSINERWKIWGSLPYVRKRQEANTYGVHNPATDFFEYTPPDLRFVDDGKYHGGFQDFTAGVKYLALDGPFSVSPFVSYGVPTSNYPIYGSAIRGRGLRELHLGVSMEFLPYFSDWLFHADVAYAISERELGVDLNYWWAHFSASYYVTPRFLPRVFVRTRRAPNALSSDYVTENYDSEIGWRHDQTLKHNFVDAGIGFDYIINNRYDIAGTYYKTIDAEDLLEIDHAFTFALTRRF